MALRREPTKGVRDMKNDGPEAKRGIIAAIVLGAGLLTIGFINHNNSPTNQALAGGSSTKTATPSTPGCKSDWTKCSDNVEMARNYEGWTEAEVKCKIAANKLAKYGTPEWPWLAFQNLASGTDYAEKGEATLIENNAKFQNEYGTMVHTRVGCDYNLRNKKVEYVDPVDLPYNIYYMEKKLPQ